MATKKILLVDDAVIIINHLIEMLKEEPFVESIAYVQNTTDAKKFLSHTIPDIIILDINLGKEHGLDVLRFIKENYPAVHVIIFTNQTNDQYKALAQKLGAAHFLDKSVDFERLGVIIAALS